ncbi:hypothetical protein IWW38_004777 [Coemansia aciculifera]|uniref:Uncharacterized protein n=1 Tax=Coemansia aciculifera TaxID=417176 RepID=A0ACC1LX26_9FUNG|nr:hypothetical protein IWW38_004777 [Coemansia aciculifera]
MDTKYTAIPMFANESTDTEDDYVFVEHPVMEDKTNSLFARKVYAIAAMQIMSMFAVGAGLFYFECTCHFISSHQWTLRAALAGAALSMAGLSFKPKCQALSVSLLASLVGTLSYFIGASFLAVPDLVSLQTLATTAGMLAVLVAATFMPGFEQFNARSVNVFAVGAVNVFSLVHIMMPFYTFDDFATTAAIALAFTGFVTFRVREAAKSSTANSDVISAVYYTNMVFFNPYIIHNVLCQ